MADALVVDLCINPFVCTHLTTWWRRRTTNAKELSAGFRPTNLSIFWLALLEEGLAATLEGECALYEWISEKNMPEKPWHELPKGANGLGRVRGSAIGTAAYQKWEAAHILPQLDRPALREVKPQWQTPSHWWCVAGNTSKQMQGGRRLG